MSQDASKDIELFKRSDTVFKALEGTIFAKTYKATDLLMIISKAYQLGMSPFDAVNGGLYAVNNKIEMTSQTMNNLIRAKGHSIQTKITSNEVCTLVGKRADNGDVMEVSFSIKDAAQAGLTSKMPWKAYPADMLFARALSRLARRLYPDIVAGCYVQGEIEPMDVSADVEVVAPQTFVEEPKYLTPEQISEIKSILGDDEQLHNWFADQMAKKGINGFSEIEQSKFQGIVSFIKDKKSKSST